MGREWAGAGLTGSGALGWDWGETGGRDWGGRRQWGGTPDVLDVVTPSGFLC